MEKKKIDKRFLLLSSINFIPAIIMGGGLTMDSLVLSVILVALVINHIILVNTVGQVTGNMASEGSSSGDAVRNLLVAMVMKFVMLGGVIALIYFYNKNLIAKAVAMVIFQLIIQVVSITTNQQKN